MKTSRAMLYPLGNRGRWRLFVGVHRADEGQPAVFPGVTFPSFPTLRHRIDALRELGFAPVSLDPWTWEEADHGLRALLVVVALVPAAVKA